MKIIGRERECYELKRCVESPRPEFVAVYGRRRVGKTYLIKEYFNKQFAFYATGISDEKTAGQLYAFNISLMDFGCDETTPPLNWFEAFARLRKLLSKENVRREAINGKIVIFLDELPWMDTPRSDFKSALDHFWNSWASSNEDILLIVCGSATSWIIDNLLTGQGGFYNRITKRIRLLPFSLKECEELILHNGVDIPRDQIVECYMALGGIPFYLNMLDSRLSIAQNIDELCFKDYGELRSEYDLMFRSLFKKPDKHMKIITKLCKKKSGMTRVELAGVPEIGGGAGLTKALRELEQCGFIRKYGNYTKKSNESYYQIIDPFILFSVNNINKGKTSWMEYINTPGFSAWRGNAFETVLLNHISQIKSALGISGVESREYSWRSTQTAGGAQIDLLIDRNDGVINLCEAKYSNNEYEIDQTEYEKIRNRVEVFREETGCKKAIHTTLITINGLKTNKYSKAAQNIITAKELFE